MVQFHNCYRPLPDCLTIGKGVHGNGIIATQDLKAGVFLGITHIANDKRGWIRTPLGGFINHSDDPNCFINTNVHYHEGDQRELYVIRPIKKREELTIYYTLPEYEVRMYEKNI
jgi:hypothetical protein